MAVVVSKTDALVEMVRAYESKQIKKANQIGNVLCKSIREDNRESLYRSYIGLDRETKQFFPIEIRKSLKKTDCTLDVQNVTRTTDEVRRPKNEVIIIRKGRKVCGAIITNRFDSCLDEGKEKVYTKELFGKN